MNAINYSPWPEQLAQQYRNLGYWTGEPLYDVITKHRNGDLEKTAVICGARYFSYRDVDELSDQLANKLLAQGLKKGDTALVQLPNCAEFYIVFFALLKVGVVPLNALFKHQQHELRSFIQQIQPELLILSHSHQLFSKSGNAFIQEFSEYQPQVLYLDAELSEKTNFFSGFHWQKNGDSFAEIPAVPKSATQYFDDTVAFFQLSGGSTGTPKLIPRTHDDYYYSIRQSVTVCEFDHNTVYLCVLPAAHNFSLSSPGALGVFYAGGCVVTTQDQTPSTCFELIEKYQVTVTAVVPPLLNQWVNHNKQESNMSSLSLIQVGGAHLNVDLAKAAASTLNCDIQQVFGMAEGLVNYTRLSDDDWHKYHTQGRPMSPNDEIIIRNKQGNPVEVGEVGSLWTRGPYTFRGYYNSDKHNKEAFDQAGFYCSGDLVRLLPDGYLQVVGRIKDQVNRGGEKIDATEVEDILLTHEVIEQVAVIGLPHDRLGECSCAVIVATKPTKPPTIRKYLREYGIADYKIPDKFYFTTCLPRTAVGKIDKNTLRSQMSKEI